MQSVVTLTFEIRQVWLNKLLAVKTNITNLMDTLQRSNTVLFQIVTATLYQLNQK